MGTGGNTAWLAALAAGLPDTTAGMTIDVQCGSGLAAITTACSMIRGGLGGTVLAGGAESASTAPWRMWPPASGDAQPRRYTRTPFAPADLGDPEMGAAADALARAAGITRERQDGYAARSHERADSAWERGAFAAELVELSGLARDERVRPSLTATKLSRLRPAFAEGGTVTVGNSCGVNDGAAAVALVDEKTRVAARLPGLACLDWASVAADPNLPGRGPVPAIRALLERNSFSLSDIGVIEITEAFAAHVLACCDELGLDEQGLRRRRRARARAPVGRLGRRAGRASVQPAGPSGRPQRGLAAIAVGGGLGVALLVERVG